MNPTFFGESKAPLFGVFHSVDSADARDTGVLICPPIGHEGIRAHRSLLQVGRQLSRAGFPVLRFDYSSTGDSAGDGGDGDATRWVKDVVSAATELTDSSGVSRLSVIGMRLGATLAACAPFRAGDVGHLVLWDPVVSGRRYLADLEMLHAGMLVDPRRFDVPRSSSGDEVLGFPMPEAQRASIAALDLFAQRSWPSAVTLVSSAPLAEYAALCAHLRDLRVAVREVPAAEATEWTALSEIENLLPVGIGVRTTVDAVTAGGS